MTGWPGSVVYTGIPAAGVASLAVPPPGNDALGGPQGMLLELAGEPVRKAAAELPEPIPRSRGLGIDRAAEPPGEPLLGSHLVLSFP
jgi:hypothetical protein